VFSSVLLILLLLGLSRFSLLFKFDMIDFVVVVLLLLLLLCSSSSCVVVVV